ncbi:MAG: hypothetical protein IJ929_00075, partial [Prevotella sp.]|nr:hypothetical protein [Prevotella sp.]
TSEDAKRFSFPQTVTIAAGETSATVEVTAIDDELPSLDLSNAFTASATKYNKAEVIVLLKDNDLPVLELQLTPTTVSESAGPVALIAVLRRTTHKDLDITVKMSDDSSGHDINYGQFSTISMSKGVEEVTFNIGINDNLIVDGDREVTITAAVYIQSCSCSASGNDVGMVSKKIHIIDNDGPALTLTSSRSMILEGAEDGTVLTISRNTSVSNPLTVSITSSNDEALDYPHNVVIPAGEQNVKVTVKALANMNEGDSKTFVFTAKADGHSDGTCWVMVSDQTLPDAIISNIELLKMDGSAIGDEGLEVNDRLQVRITIANAGVIDLPAGLAVNVYQNSRPTTSLTTSQSVPSGESITLTCNVKVDDQVGTFSVFATVNEDNTTPELLYVNNTSATVSVNAHASFTATVSVDKSVLLYGDSVTISGQLNRPDGTAWQSDGSTTVVLYLIMDGQRFTEGVTANAKGEFTYVWKPYRYQIGHIGIGACYPGENLRDEMASVDIYGMRHKSTAPITLYTVIGKPYDGTLSIVNPGNIPLTGLTVTVAENSDSADIVLNAPQRIEGGQTVDIAYTLTGRKLGSGNKWQTVKLSITTAEGAELNKTIYYYTRNEVAQLSCSVQQINTTMTKGTTRDYMFNVANVGMGTTGIVSLSLPTWMQSVTPKNIAPLENGDTTQVIIRFAPTDDMQLNVPVTGQIGINCENGNGLAIPFRIEPVSEITGNLVVDVCDEYTYYTEEAPHVSGATVSILHPVTGAVIVSDTTTATGLFTTTLPEGYYTLLVTHPKHNGYRANILLDPGKTTTKVVNLTIDAINVSWDVVETSVEDTYEIVTSVKYETNIPAPVVLVSVPSYIPAKSLPDGESLVFYAALTNVGLIKAKSVQFEMPDNFKVLTYTPLDYADSPFDLAPQQTIFIPIMVTNTGMISASRGEQEAKRPVDDDPCYAEFPLSWFYECGTDSVFHKYPTGIRVGECKERPSGYSGVGGGYGGFTGPGGGSSGPGGPTPGNYFTTINYDYVNPGVSTGEPYKCTPCANSAFIALAKLLPFVGDFFRGAETVRDIYNCADAMINEKSWRDKFTNCKYTKSTVDAYDRYVGTVKDIFKDFDDIADGTNRIANRIKDKEFFTRDCLNDWKDIGKAFYHLKADMTDLSIQTVNIANKMNNMYKKGKEVIQEEKEFRAEMNRRIYNSSDYRDELRLDRIAEGTTSLSKAKQEADRKKNLSDVYAYADQDIATTGDYVDFLDKSMKVVKGENLTRKEMGKMLQDGVKISSNYLYNLHNFTESAKTTNVTNQTLLKNSYIDNTNKLVEAIPKITDLIHYTFGDCEYEGTQVPEEPEDPEGQEEGGSRSHGPRKAITVNLNELPESYKKFLDDLVTAMNIIKIAQQEELEFFGSSEWLTLPSDQISLIAWAIECIQEDGIQAISNPNIMVFCPSGISEEAFITFLTRYYNSYYKTETSSSRRDAAGEENTIDLQHIGEINETIGEEIQSILKDGETSVEKALINKLNITYDELNDRSNTVCASITLQFNQTMTMTRQAFRGTLKVHNGNPEESMKDIILELDVRNASDGSLATSREMQVNVEMLDGFEGSLNLTDGWTLVANGDGTATILFIPSKYAAPTEPIDYTFGGRLKYLDPFTGLMVTRELSPVTLTVKPSPELDLTYFMQRDVYGDDALTLDVVEPMKPAEFALLINNKGFGDATNVRMVTQQPEIIDNEKGLYIDFELISSQVNGGEAALSFGKSIANDFGDIPAHSQMYAQWWLTSTLLGHFIDYKVEASHVTSYGNEDLSLLDQVTIHELIHGFDMPKGSLTGGPEIGRAFLVNDIADALDNPDKLYFTNGDTASVVIAATATTKRLSDTQCELTVTPSAKGWNYGSIYDPTHGYAELKSIVRKS